jgi:hypothetical protein
MNFLSNLFSSLNPYKQNPTKETQTEMEEMEEIFNPPIHYMGVN